MITVVILAAGKQTRWAGPHAKQLVHIGNGQALIERTIAQARRTFNVEPYIVTTNQDIAVCGNWSILPAGDTWTVETLHSTKEIWQDRVIVLLGDTYYSDAVLFDVLNDKSSIMFYGRQLEIYALSFDDHGTIIMALEKALLQARGCPPNTKGGNYGKLWHIWYILNGYSVSRHTTPGDDDRYFQYVHQADVTMDIDTEEDYLALVRKIGADL